MIQNSGNSGKIQDIFLKKYERMIIISIFITVKNCYYEISFFQSTSYHEMAVIDVPAVIDYILNETNKKDIIYIGHSMGTTISYILLSTRPEYNEKIRLVISMAPVAFWHDPLPSSIQGLRQFIPAALVEYRIYNIKFLFIVF